MKKIIITLSVIAIGLALYVVFFPAPAKFSGATEQKLDKFISENMQITGAPGMVLYVNIPGRGQYFRAVGTSEIAARTPMDPNKIFRIGSLTKTFTGTVALQLVDEGKLKLSEPLSKYLSWVPNSANISIRQLLGMTSGLHSYSETQKFQRMATASIQKQWLPEELVKIGVAEKPYFPPGKGFYYSNTNTVILGMIIEKITKNSLQNEVKKRIIDRLGLRHTYFPFGSEIPEKEYMHGYMLEGGKLVDRSSQNASWGWAAGAVISNIADLKTYIAALGDGALVGSKLQRERFKNGYYAAEKKYLTLRYCLAAFKMAGFVGHNGSLPGYMNIAMYNPKTKAVIILMQNIQSEEKGTLDMLAEVLRILYPKMTI